MKQINYILYLMQATTSQLNIMVQVSVTCFASLFVAFYFTWKLTLLLLASIPILVVAGFVRSSQYSSFAEKEEKSLLSASLVGIHDMLITIIMFYIFYWEQVECIANRLKVT